MNLPDWLHTLTGYARQHPLGYRMMAYISACSFIFILFSTAVQLSLDYGRELRVIDQQVELINRSYLASLAKSLWDLDQAQVELQLLGIQTLPDVTHVQLRNVQTGSILKLPSQPPRDSRQLSVHQFELIHTTSSQQSRNLGQLQVSFDLQAVVARVWQTGLSSLLNQALLVLLIVAVIMIIVQRQITRHLEGMANYSREIAAGRFDSSLKLDRTKPERPDELDQLAQALNDMRQAIRQDRDQLQLMVERRTASLRQAKEAAEQADKTKSQFLSTMSHEIRTPLNGMLGMIQLLESSPLSSEQRQQMHVLHDATDALLETFDHILQYGQLEEGGWVARDTRFALPALLQSLISLLSPGAEHKQLTLRLETDPLLAEQYFGAAGSLRQILTNLLSNAIKFTDSGQITLRCQQQPNGWLRFEVQDTGIGIAPALQQHIFDRFTQADESITRRFGGTGLGLAICRQLAQALGGQIGLTSSPGQGSLFWLELPMAASADSTTSAAETSTGNQQQTPALQILLVEDVEINQQVILGLLSQQPHQITIATDGHQALQLSQQHSYDLILMDMHLPGLSGLEVSQHIRIDASNPNHNSPIIALTASVRPDEVSQYLQSGLQSVIAKPVRQTQLLQTIAQYHPANNHCVPPTPQPDSALSAAPPLIDSSVLELHREMLGIRKVTELMRSFQTLINTDWPALQRSLSDDDLYEVAQLAHKMAGACDTLGFSLASQQLRKMENQADTGTVHHCQALIPVLTHTLDATLKQADKQAQP